MEPSDEIRDGLLRLYEVLNTGDERGFEALWSRREGAVAVTTDYEEWHRGHREIVGVYRVQREGLEALRASGAAPPSAGEGPAWRPGRDLRAFQEGSVGWAFDRPRFVADGKSRPYRITALFHLERSIWKLVHVHLSLGVPNETVFGWKGPTSIEAIAEDVASDRSDVRAAAAPNGTVTILFTDIENSTQRAETVGDRAWMRFLREHNAIIREQTSFNGGYEVKSQGDGFMLAFPSARDALRAAIGIQRAVRDRDDGAPLVRIGLHTGEAIREANDFYGRAVIMAARVAAVARGGQILTSSLVRELVESTDEFEFGESIDLELKGLSGTHRVWAVRS